MELLDKAEQLCLEVAENSPTHDEMAAIAGSNMPSLYMIQKTPVVLAMFPEPHMQKTLHTLANITTAACKILD